MTIEVTAKKADDAIKQGLEQLGATYDDVKIEVLETGGFFRKARVRLTLEEPEKNDGVKEPAKAPEKTELEKPAPQDQKPTEQEQKAKPEVKPDVKPAAKPVAKKDAKVKNGDAPSEENRCEKSQDRPSAQKEKNTVAQKAQGAKNRHEKPSRDPSDKAETECEGNVDSRSDESNESDAPVRKAKRRLRAEDREAAAHALEFVKKTVELMGFDGATAAADDDIEHIEITAAEGDDSLIIGRHGETLSALTYLAETCARAEKCHVNIVVDCNGYRARRAASLVAMAKRRARESAQKHRRIKLEPMDRTDRRTVHCALADDEYVTTASEGKEPYRYVVIAPKDGEAYDYDGRERGRRDRDRRGGKGGQNRGQAPAGEKPRRAAFDINIHGFVGHNDPAPEESAPVEAESDAKDE